MKDLQISPDFTVEDIHKIREYNYERRKDLTFEEYRKDLKNSVRPVLQRMTKLKYYGEAV